MGLHTAFGEGESKVHLKMPRPPGLVQTLERSNSSFQAVCQTAE